MLKRFKKLLSKKKHSTIKPHLVDSEQYSIDSKRISRNALTTCEQLQQSGFSAYIVGGAVRDLLLNLSPKDFDIATNATPEEVKKVIRRSMIIGKRFKIVHARFGREIIEITTFRADHKQASTRAEADQAASGVLLRDNVYGDIESDANRRDLSVNALYYDPLNKALFDFANGLQDLNERQLKMIGVPEERYKEDPVRMLRVIRFAAKLGFNIEPITQAPIVDMAHNLSHISSSRLFEETLKLLLSGQATATISLLQEYGLFKHLFPSTAAYLAENDDFEHKLIQAVAVNTDKRIRQHKRVTPAFIYAVFLWIPLQRELKQLRESENRPVIELFNQACQTTISQQLAVTSIPKRFLIPMRDIWSLQQRLLRREGRKAYNLLKHPKFRAAYDFLLLREDAGEDLNDLGKWWTDFQDADDEQKEHLIKDAGRLPGKKRPKKRRRKASDKPQQESPLDGQPPT